MWETWKELAKTNGIDDTIVASHNPHDDKPFYNGYPIVVAYPTLRTWEAISDRLKQNPKVATGI